jgi:hypothetical protein
MQLLPALVGRVERIEEGDRVGDVDQHRQVQLAGSRPQRVESRIVHRHQRAVLIAHMQAEWLPDLQPLGATRGLRAKLGGGPLTKSIAMLGPLAPIDSAEDSEALGRSGLEMIEPLVQNLLTPAAVEVDIHAHIGLVERVEQLADRPLAPAAAEIRAKVIMRVDHREARPCDRRRLGDKRGMRQKLMQVQITIHSRAFYPFKPVIVTPSTK